jgi:hypothetical protein
MEFIDWRYSQTCWYFQPSFVNFCPSNILCGSPPPPLPPSQSQSTVYTDSVWLRGGAGRGCCVELETIFCCCKSLTHRCPHLVLQHLSQAVHHLNIHPLQHGIREVRDIQRLPTTPFYAATRDKRGQRHTEITHNPLLFNVTQGIF